MKTHTKITATIVLTAIVSGAVFSGLSYYQSRDAISQAAFADMEALRNAKSVQIEEFFGNKIHAADSLSQDVLVATAITYLQAAFRNINQGGETVLADVSSDVRDYYERRALPPIAKSLGKPNASFDIYGPKTRAARHLQNIFNVQPKSSKPPRQKSYEAYHSQYDGKLKSMAAINGFADILLIDMYEGDVIYSAQKGIDFGTNVYNGAFANSVLGQIVDEVRNTPTLHISDIELYAPANSEASIFVAAPIYDQNVPIGIIALRLKAEQVSELSAFGLTERGDRDVYLVGGDYLMRSNAPFAQNNLNAYVRVFKDAGGTEDVARKIKLGGSTILAQSVESEAVSAALSGRSGTIVTQNYLGNPVISAYAPIDIGGNDWVILAERHADDVYVPFINFAKRLAIAAAIFVPLLLLLALWMATRLMRPARAMMETARVIAGGENLAFAEDKNEWGRIGLELNKAVDLDPWQAPVPRQKIEPRKPIKLISIETPKKCEAKTAIETEAEFSEPKEAKIRNSEAKPPIEATLPKKEKHSVAVLVSKAPVESVEPELETQEASIPEAVVETNVEVFELPDRKLKPKRPKRAARSDAGIKSGAPSVRVMAPRARRKTLPPMSLLVNKPSKTEIESTATDDIKPSIYMQEPLVLTKAIEAETLRLSKPLKVSESEGLPLSDTPTRFRRRRRR